MTTRKLCIDLVLEAVQNGARMKEACKILFISVRTLERWRKSPDIGDSRNGPNSEPANKFSVAERAEVIRICNSVRFKNLPPSQIVPLLADDGVYIASEATMYRILKEEGLLSHRTNSKPRKRHKPMELIATKPNEVWTWDVTYLKTHVKGAFYYLNMIIDVFSRKIVGWDVYLEDNSDNASLLAEITCLVEGIERDQITLHSDNGKSQKGATTLGTLQKLGVAPSFSRPSVSNDNPYSESLFKTLKYRPTYPEQGFASVEDATNWVVKFVDWYNTEHLHSGIKFVTPESRHLGADVSILQARKRVYDKAKLKNPDRWSKDVRDWKRINYVLLNPLTSTREMYKLEEASK